MPSEVQHHHQLLLCMQWKLQQLKDFSLDAADYLRVDQFHLAIPHFDILPIALNFQLEYFQASFAHADKDCANVRLFPSSVFFQKIFVVLAQAVVLYTTHSNKLFHLFPHKEVTSLLPRMFLIHNMEDDTMQLRFYAFELF